MGCLGSVCRKIIVGILSLIKVGVSIAIIIIVSMHLWDVTVSTDVNNFPVSFNAKCLLSGDVDGTSVCNYTYAVCGLSMLLSLCTSLLLCITCDLCGLGDWLQFIVQAFQTAWWTIAAIIITKKVKDTNDLVLPDGSGWPNEGWRIAVAVLCWVNVGIAGLLALIFLFQACQCLRGCCSCCCDDDDDDRRNRA